MASVEHTFQAMEGDLKRAIDDKYSRTEAGGGVTPNVGTSIRPKVPSPLTRVGAPTAQEIVKRLSLLNGKLRELDENATVIANILAGPRPSSPTAGEKRDEPATLFALMAQALDEIDRIVDNTAAEQVRAREIISE